MNQTFFGPREFILDMSSSSYRELKAPYSSKIDISLQKNVSIQLYWIFYNNNKKKGKFSDKYSDIFHILLKTQIVGTH